MPTNDERAAWAYDACVPFAEATGLKVEDELPTVIIDLIANLLHLASQDGLCAESLLEAGRMHYEAEIKEEEGCNAND